MGDKCRITHNTEYFDYTLMKTRLKQFVVAGITCLCLQFQAQAYEEDELPYVEIAEVADFARLAQEAQRNEKVIMLEMSASYCGYCRTLEEEIIKPMLRSGDYTDNVLIRKLEIDRRFPMNNIDGGKTSPAEIAAKYDIFVTPTLIFIDGEGKEVSERILGVNTLEYYGVYVDEALKIGLQKIKSR